MERREEFHAVHLGVLAAELGDAGLRVEQRLDGDVAQAADDLGLDEPDLLEEPRHARRHLVKLRRAVSRRPAFKNVRDVDLPALDADLLERFRQELPRAPHEGLALRVLVLPRRLAHEHERRLERPYSEYDLGSRRAQTTLRALQYRRSEFFEVVWVGLGFLFPRRCRC